MILKMAGFDHTTSSLEEREQLALTKTEIRRMLSSVSGMPDVEGCVYVSTCGRGELYLFCEDSVDVAALLAERFVAERVQDPAGFTGKAVTLQEDRCENPAGRKAEAAGRFRVRTGRDAADHLFHTACGMCSQIYGEDQILAQLKQSLELAREAHSAGGAIDRLFLSAIAAAKKVKSTVRLTAVPASVADRMLALLESETQVPGKNCLVIGNGEVGRLCAAKLLEAGAKVTVTVRNYRTREVVIPVGCQIVDYRERFSAVSAADVIVSATTSPHYTLPYPSAAVPAKGKLSAGAECSAEQAEEETSPADGDRDTANPLLDGRRRFLFDLALPRDIAPEYGKVPGISLFGLDEVSAGVSDEQTDAAMRAEEILKAEEGYFFDWLGSRETARQAVHVGELAAEDVTGRVSRRVRKALEGDRMLSPEDGSTDPSCAEGTEAGMTVRQPEEAHPDAREAARRVEAIYSDAVKKVVDNLMYDLKSRLPEEQWKAVVEAMEQSVLARAAEKTGRCRGTTSGSEEESFVRFPGECGSEHVKAAASEEPDCDEAATSDELESAEAATSDGAGPQIAFFPLFLDTRKKNVLIYGAGHIALRRVKKLLDFACGIHIVAPEAEEELSGLTERYPERIRYENRRFEEEELLKLLKRSAVDKCGRERPEGSSLCACERFGGSRLSSEPAAGGILFVVAATDDRSVNRRIGELCRAYGMPVSVADRKEESTCYFPGIAAGSLGREGARIVAGISSEGADHAGTAEAVKRIAEMLDGSASVEQI